MIVYIDNIAPLVWQGATPTKKNNQGHSVAPDIGTGQLATMVDSNMKTSPAVENLLSKRDNYFKI